MRGGNRIALQHLQRHDFERRFFAGLHDDARRNTRLKGLEPAQGTQAPSIAWLQPREVKLRPRGGEIVTLFARIAQESFSDLGTDDMTTGVMGLRSAESITVEPRFGSVAAGLQRCPQYI